MRGVWAENEGRTAPAGDSGLVRHYKEGAVMGYVEVLRKASRLLENIRFCKEDIVDFHPDVVILIDYPGFNFKIAKFAHTAGYKVFYYIAPKVWASREGRIKKLKAYVDKLFIVFPFEVPYFTAKGVDFVYEGNPLVDAVDNSAAVAESREAFLQRCGLQDKPIVALLAGSRKGEISTMMPVLMEFSNALHQLPQYADYQFIIAGAPSRSIADYQSYLSDAPAAPLSPCHPVTTSPSVAILFGETYSILRHAEVAVVNSGTASLETVLLNTPHVVGYRMNPITALIGRMIIKVKYISLGNLCIDRLAFKELLQHHCSAENILAEVRLLLEDEAYRAQMLEDYAQIRALLGGSGCSAKVAQAMINALKD